MTLKIHLKKLSWKLRILTAYPVITEHPMFPLPQHLERDTTLYKDLCETFGECEECNKNSDDKAVAPDSNGKVRARKRVDFLSKHRTKIVSDDLWFLHVTLQQVL